MLGGEQPNAADFQIGGSLALLMSFEDVRERIESRPAAGLVQRLFSWYPGHVQPVVPARVARAAAAGRSRLDHSAGRNSQARGKLAGMAPVEVERTLVKSPPELWTEIGTEEALGRWLGDVT